MRTVGRNRAPTHHETLGAASRGTVTMAEEDGLSYTANTWALLCLHNTGHALHHVSYLVRSC